MAHAEVVQQVARLPFPAEDGGSNPALRLHYETATASEVAPLLAAHHYLGPTKTARVAFAAWTPDNVMAACQVWRWPTARMLPNDGTWLELSRWCITPACPPNTGSSMMGWARRWIRRNMPTVHTLVSYSDASKGHNGGLYRASGWVHSPTHHTDRLHANGVGYPSGHGTWDGVTIQHPKDRWTTTIRQPRKQTA